MQNDEQSNEMFKYVQEHDFPTDILIETVRGCNLACPMCPSKNSMRQEGSMSFDLWKKIVDDIAAETTNVTIWPAMLGEPLLLDDQLFRYIRYAKDKAIRRICLNTNLQLFNEKLVDPLFQSGLDEIIIGIDGCTKETYEKIRVGAIYDRVLKNIELLVMGKRQYNSGLKIILQMVLQDDNEHEETSFMQFWKEKKYGVLLKIRHRLSWGGSIDPYHKLITESPEMRKLPCLWLLRQIFIHHDGKVPYCDCPGADIIGDVKTQTIREIWHGDLKRFRDKHLSGVFDNYPCNQCSDWQAKRSTIIETEDTSSTDK